jgi:uncharacterized repeat protein (TIGR03803 family)
MTFSGGTNGSGTVFQITSSGALTKLHDFTDTPEGANPRDRLYQDADGNFYGTTVHGGTNDLGTVFQMTSAGTVTTVYQFNGVTDGYRPFAGLALGSDGNFYGTTQEGRGSTNCNGGCGTVFVLNLNPGMIAVSSITGLGSSGVASGPFAPASQVYTVTNTGTLSLNWSASNGQNWVSLSATNGSLPGNESTNVTVSINSAANTLDAGSYSDTVTFNNDTDGNGTTYRTVSLMVLGTRIISIQRSGDDMVLNISTLANEWYCVEFTDDLVTGTWGVLAGNVQGTGDIMQFVDAGRAILSQGFYRLRLAPSADDACGGICPTFIQPPPGSAFINPLKTAFTQTATGLYGKIVVPVANALLRSDIPIYGVAGGRNFRKFRVEYGPGRNPTEWHPLASSNKPQISCPEFKDISWMQGDLDLRGNLATWNTGLKNWEHLPWHPADDPTDFNGVYTIRLVVEGEDGKTVEDRVTCEVGRAIAQCLPGIAISPDKRAVMRFPEQSLMHPFRVYTILPLSSVGEETPLAPPGSEYLGPVYRIREPGDKFIKDVALEFTPASSELETRQLDRIGVGQYDTEAKKWVWLNMTRTTDGAKFRTVLTELPTPQAIYALLVDATESRSMVTNEAGVAVAEIKPVSASVLVENTFQHDLGTFKSRDRIVGVSLSRAKRNDKDISFCIQLRNDYSGGNSSCTVLDRSFDVRQYPVMSFDYRVGPDFNTDFFLKVNGRWYDLQFTGEATDYHDRDVNIGNLGKIEGVVTDGQWHSVTVDLERMLRQKTGHTRIEEIALGNWKVGGYMKLEFGQNPQGAMLWLDSFKIHNPRPGTEQTAAPPVLWIDRFDSNRALNDLGQNSGVFSSSGPSRCVVKRVSDGNPNAQALQVDYEVPVPGAYGGYWTLLGDLDGHNYRALRA